MAGLHTDFWAQKYKLWVEHAENKRLWDILLRCDDGTAVHASSADLAAWSSYFAALFTGTFNDSSSSEVHLKDVSGTALQAILDSKYGSKDVAFTKDSVCSILDAADLLQFTDVTKQCEQFMASMVDKACAPYFHALADKHTLTELKQSTAAYINVHLPAILDDAKAGSDLVEMQPTALLDVLKGCDSKWRRGTYLLSLWEDHMLPAGLSVQQLLDCIDLGRCSQQDLAELLSHPLVEKDVDFVHSIAAAALQQPAYQLPCIPTELLPNVGHHLQFDGFKIGVCWHVTPWSSRKESTSAIMSPFFAIPGRVGSWKLQLYPKGNGQSTHLSLFLVAVTNELDDAELEYKLCLLNRNEMSGDLGKFFSGRGKFAEKGMGRGVREFLALSQLEENPSEWIRDDSLVFAVTYKP